ncbi:MAG: hypothetical protein KAU46_02715 [Candidatus Aminicenantes bacterium]|nr:hypothetical protein [Candidatus Aminicenantes bacterium]
MFGSLILEVVIGIIFVYLLLSLICSAINEFISMVLSRRSKNLEAGIQNLLSDPGNKSLVKDFYDHPLIKGLQQKGKKPPYIPSRTFALVLMDIIAPADPSTGSRALEYVRDSVAKLSNSHIKQVLLLFMDEAENNLNKAREFLENWYDDAMERVSGWYKRKTQVIILCLSIAISVAFNADTLMIANTLSRDAAIRASVVAAAENIRRQPLSSEQEPAWKQLEKLQGKLLEHELPIGWSQVSGDSREVPRNFPAWVKKILGLLFTAIAVSLGAPFWFDMLNKFVNLRSSGIQPKTAKQQK